MYDSIVIGCGVVGAATACALSRYRLNIGILEAENDVAMGTTKANSAIVHAGYDPKPGTLMARLNVEGAAMMPDLCARLDVPYRQAGSLVLAFDKQDLAHLQKLYDRGVRNDVPGLALWDAETLHKEEPNVSDGACGALYAPTAGIVSPWELCLALAETAVRNGAQLHLQNRVKAIEPTQDGFLVTTDRGQYHTRTVLNAAGIHADAVHNLVCKPEFTITPNRGQYFLLDKSQGNLVKHVIFQCPTAAGKGVLVSPTVHGNLIIGPDAVDAGDVATTGTGLAFVKTQAARSVPGVDYRQNIRNFAGLRAIADQDDFILRQAVDTPGFFDLAGIKSPGLTAAPAIGRYAAELLRQSGMDLKEKTEFMDMRRVTRFRHMDAAQRAAVIAQNPAYAHVICRCETVTEGEILDCLQGPIPPVSIDGVKRRVGAGMGRCQGGFCGPRVLEILAKAQQRPWESVEQDGVGSYILTGKTKEGTP